MGERIQVSGVRARGNENADGRNVNDVNDVVGEEGVDEERGNGVFKGPVSCC